MGDIRIRVAHFAEETFPYAPNLVEALRSLIAIATEIVEDVQDIERMLAIPVGGTSEDPCTYYESCVAEEDPW